MGADRSISANQLGPVSAVRRPSWLQPRNGPISWSGTSNPDPWGTPEIVWLPSGIGASDALQGGHKPEKARPRSDAPGARGARQGGLRKASAGDGSGERCERRDERRERDVEDDFRVSHERFALRLTRIDVPRRTELSSLPEARMVPSGLNAIVYTASVCPRRGSPSAPPVATSQRRTVRSSLTDAMSWPSGLKATPRTARVWPRSGGTANLPVSKSQIRTVPSPFPDAIRLPAVLVATDETHDGPRAADRSLHVPRGPTGECLRPRRRPRSHCPPG